VVFQFLFPGHIKDEVRFAEEIKVLRKSTSHSIPTVILFFQQVTPHKAVLQNLGQKLYLKSFI
jgi:hypothetical protein